LYAAGGEGADGSNGSSVGEPLDANDRVAVPGEVDRDVEQSNNRTDGENRNQLPISTNKGSVARGHKRSSSVAQSDERRPRRRSTRRRKGNTASDTQGKCSTKLSFDNYIGILLFVSFVANHQSPCASEGANVGIVCIIRCKSPIAMRIRRSQCRLSYKNSFKELTKRLSHDPQQYLFPAPVFSTMDT